MRRGIGVIFTTGVALVGATVVVANPVSAPPSDVRVPAVQLSAGSATSTGALDRALLEAIAQNRREANPVGPLKRLLAGVVTDVALLGGRAAEKALRGPDEVEAPPARAWSPQSQAPPNAVADLLSGKPVDTAADNAPTAVIEDPALQRGVRSVADYVGYVSVQSVEATVAAGTVTPAEPKLIAERLATLAHGDVDAAINTALRAVAAPLGPLLTVVKAIRTEVGKRLTELRDPLRRSRQSLSPAAHVTRAAAARTSTSLRGAVVHRRATDPTTVNGATDLTDGNKAVPHQRASQTPLRQRDAMTLNQARASLERFGDAVRKAITPHRPHRAHRR